METKRILVTGGAGLIGSHLCNKLLERGHRVVCLDFVAGDAPAEVDAFHHDARMEYVSHDITLPFRTEADAVFNLASPTSPVYFNRYPVDTLRTNILGALNTLDIARGNHARLVYTSSADIYGFLRSPSYSENATANGHASGFRAAIADGKRAAESLCNAYRTQYDTDTRIARIFNTSGDNLPLTDSRVIPTFVTAALTGRDIVIYGSGEQTRSFCWVGDTVEALLRLMEVPAAAVKGPVNIGDSHEITINSLAQKIIELSGSRSRIVHLPPVGDEPRHKTPDITRARQLLGWEPQTSLDEGLERTIAYFETKLSEGSPIYERLSWAELN